MIMNKKKPKYRIVYNKKAEIYKIQERISFGRWSDLGHMREGRHVIAYYSNRDKVDQELEKLYIKDDLVLGKNWEVL